MGWFSPSRNDSIISLLQSEIDSALRVLEPRVGDGSKYLDAKMETAKQVMEQAYTMYPDGACMERKAYDRWFEFFKKSYHARMVSAREREEKERLRRESEAMKIRLPKRDHVEDMLIVNHRRIIEENDD